MHIIILQTFLLVIICSKDERKKVASSIYPNPMPKKWGRKVERQEEKQYQVHTHNRQHDDYDDDDTHIYYTH